MPGNYSPFARRAYALPPVRGHKPPAPSKGGGDIITSIFADGTDGFYFDFSRLDRLWQGSDGTTPVVSAGQNIGRALSLDPDAVVASQATVAAQPKYQTGGLARFDGLDDCLPSSLQIANTGSLVVKFNKAVGNSSQAIIGQRPNTSSDAYLLLNSSGFVSGSVGTGVTLAGSSNLAGVNVVAGLTWNGTTVNLYAQGQLIATQAQAGTITATASVIVGSALTSSLFAEVDIYRALAIKKALTAAEIAAITNLWGTT